MERLTYLPFWSNSFPANTTSEAILSEMNGCPCALVESPTPLLLSLLVESPLEIQHCSFQRCPGVVVTLHPCSSSVHHLLLAPTASGALSHHPGVCSSSLQQSAGQLSAWPLDLFSLVPLRATPPLCGQRTCHQPASIICSPSKVVDK